MTTMTAEQELAALKTKLRAAGFSHGYAIEMNDGTYVTGGAMSFDDARKKRIAMEWMFIRNSGTRPSSSTEFNTIINNAPAVALKAA